jgi:uncharacterized protein YjiK
MNAGCERVGSRLTRWRALAVVGVAAAAAIGGAAPAHAALTGIDLSSYQRVGRYDLPTPPGTAAPAGSLLAQEASGVTYDWDTNSLFVVGDGGTSVVQVSLTGQLIDSMTLPAGGSPQGTEFYDLEGITYVGGGKFVFTEERYRQLVLFTYAPGTTLTRAAAQTVKAGSTIGNIGNEGVSWDPSTNSFIVVKETQPEGIFQTSIDFDAGTSSNGNATTEPTNLFDPSLAGLDDFSDVYALSNVTGLTGTADASHLLIISQESGKIENVGRDGHVYSTLTIPQDADTQETVPDQTHEGVTVDKDGTVYDVSEEGGGGANKPQLWVYRPQAGGGTNQAPTGVTLTNQVTSLPQSTSTASRVKVADVNVADDGLGTNHLSVTGADAASFEVDSTGLYIKAGTALSTPSYTVSVAVDDTSVGSTPDAASAPLTVTITTAAAPASLAVTEVSPWSSGDSSYAADWWELTNTGTQPADLTGYRMDDDSNSSANAVALNGVGSLAPGQSAIFIEGGPAQVTAFESFWFGASVPAGFQMGYYSGSGVGLSTGGDQVNIFAPGTTTHVTGVSFGASTSGKTFDNPAGASGAITALSAAGKNGAFTVGAETGSPGAIKTSTVSTSTSGDVIAAVPSQMVLTLGAPAAFGPLTIGTAKDFLATTSATVSSTAGDATLSVVDAGTTAPGHLVNGAFSLPQALLVDADGGDYVTLSGTPATLKTYGTPITDDNVAIGLEQPIGANDALRSGGYSKTLTFTLSTTTP